MIAIAQILAWIVPGYVGALWLRRNRRLGFDANADDEAELRAGYWILPLVLGPILLLVALMIIDWWRPLVEDRMGPDEGVNPMFRARKLLPRSLPSWQFVHGTFSLIIAALVAVGVLLLIFMSWRTIEPGYVGIVFDKASRRVTNTLDPGWVIINPLTQSITRYPISIQTLVMVKAGDEGRSKTDDSVLVGSKEGQTMHADVSVQYSVERDRAVSLYQAWAGAPIERIEDNLVRQVTRSALNDVASQFGWEDIYGERRVEYTQRVSEEIARRFALKYVKFEGLNLRGWHLTPALQKVVDQKIAAQQAANQQLFALEQAKIKALQDRVAAEGQANAIRAQANGEADATRLRAQAEADATRIRAEAQTDANRQLGPSLSRDLMLYQQLQKWDGRMPLVTDGNAAPLLSMGDVITTTNR